MLCTLFSVASVCRNQLSHFCGMLRRPLRLSLARIHSPPRDIFWRIGSFSTKSLYHSPGYSNSKCSTSARMPAYARCRVSRTLCSAKCSLTWSPTRCEEVVVVVVARHLRHLLEHGHHLRVRLSCVRGCMVRPRGVLMLGVALAVASSVRSAWSREAKGRATIRSALGRRPTPRQQPRRGTNQGRPHQATVISHSSLNNLWPRSSSPSSSRSRSNYLRDTRPRTNRRRRSRSDSPFLATWARGTS